MNKSNYEFTHEWVTGVEWMRTSYTPADFTVVEPLSQRKREVIFVAENFP